RLASKRTIAEPAPRVQRRGRRASATLGLGEEFWAKAHDLRIRPADHRRVLARIVDRIEHGADAVEPRPPLVVRPHDRPGSMRGVRGGKHAVTRPGVVVEKMDRLVVELGELPAFERIVPALVEAVELGGPPDIEPELPQKDSFLDEEALEDRGLRKKARSFFFGAEPHHRLDAGAVVPGAIEEDDLASARQMRDIALKVPLAPLGFGRL